MIKVGIVGISGYSGKTLLESLLKHEHVRITYVSANNTEGKIVDIWPQFKSLTNLVCKKFNAAEISNNCQLAFLAVPHTIGMQLSPQLLKANLQVIDLSADYRIKSAPLFKKWYNTKHTDSKNLKRAIYGLPEFYREDIKKSQLVANPGCYPTAALLALGPFASTHADNIDSITIDAKSGTSGAGKKATIALNFSEVNENFKAYKVLQHQHTPEINFFLSKMTQNQIKINFVPHLLPITRGIQETIYIQLKTELTIKNLHTLYKRFYKTEPFIRILPLGQQPEIKNVAGNNFCDIGLAISENKKLLVITTVIDNLMKGASGQAIQNMNLMNGIEETTGLI